MAESPKDASAERRAKNRAKGEARTYERVRARPIEPGARVMITHRCHDRRMFMTPYGDPEEGHTEKETEDFYGYTVARAVMKYGVDFHAGLQMGNHHHLGMTDRLGNRPNFKNSVHSNLARGFNARFGRFDSFWSGGGSCDTVTPSDDETLEDLAYIDCNPVAAGLVKWGRLWPGFTTYGWRFGESKDFTRPHWYYDDENPDNHDVITLTRVRPDIFPELTDDELSDKLMERCREIEIQIQDEFKEKNQRFMGLQKLAKSKWYKRATSPEERFTEIPTVAASQADKRDAELARMEDWRLLYAAAREKHQAGDPTVLPFGAYFLPKLYRVPVAPRPP